MFACLICMGSSRTQCKGGWVWKHNCLEWALLITQGPKFGFDCGLIIYHYAIFNLRSPFQDQGPLSVLRTSKIHCHPRVLSQNKSADLGIELSAALLLIWQVSSSSYIFRFLTLTEGSFGICWQPVYKKAPSISAKGTNNPVSPLPTGNESRSHPVRHWLWIQQDQVAKEPHCQFNMEDNL